MASSHPTSLFISLAVLLASSTVLVSAREFKVGGDLGWLEPPATNATWYNQWATAHRFRIGDTLVFEYENDTVVEVEKWGYFHCDTSQPVLGFKDGNSTVRLDRPGLFYFVSASVDHCKRGMRMIVHVMSPKPPPSSAPSPAQSSAISLALAPLSFLLTAVSCFI